MSPPGPCLISGSRSVDDRGAVAFVNDFDTRACRRFYTVENHQPGTVRAWHAHKHERKWVTVLRGTALVCCVAIDNFESPAREAAVERFVLDHTKPAVLEIPGGYANGSKTLAAGTQLLYFSDKTLDESSADDYRYDARYWDPWQLVER